MEKKIRFLKRAMTEKRERWQNKEWKDQNPHGTSQPGKTAARAHTHVENSQRSGKWKEISAEMDAVGTTVKEKTHTWNKSCKESVKRETELYEMVEAAVMDEKQEQKETGMIRDLLGQLQKRREEEDEARGSSKRWNAISRRPRTEVTKWNGSWAEYSGNTLKPSDK